MTYEIPLALKRDVSDTVLRDPATGQLAALSAAARRKYPAACLLARVTARRPASGT
jgi:hypothetical protein